MAALTIYFTDGESIKLHYSNAQTLAKAILHYRYMLVNHLKDEKGRYIDSIDLNNEILFH